MGAKIGGSGGPQADINVTPLVDIVLVLLIIFMVITPLLAKNIPVEVPQKTELDEPQPETIKDQMVLKLFADGHVELNKEPIDLSILPMLLEEKYMSRAEKILFFEGEDDAVYGQAITLMDMAKGAGIATIGIMTSDFDPSLPSGLAGADYGATYGAGAAAAAGPRLGQVGTGAPTVLGGADPAALQSAIQPYLGDLLACYEAEAAKGLALAGQVITKVEVSASGTPSEVSTQSSTLNNPAVESCLVGIFRRMNFPAGPASTVAFPVGFQPSTSQ
ncbi:MAG TPA: hypothetical protein DIU15_16935 [Deltaproteobacteria bacterium]|nr:hypothetical protein [Deltaproteobacteria bacterium]HCP47729.1 hypothetical protein [Deltaproteobacteria bacterium]